MEAQSLIGPDPGACAPPKTGPTNDRRRTAGITAVVLGMLVLAWLVFCVKSLVVLILIAGAAASDMRQPLPVARRTVGQAK